MAQWKEYLDGMAQDRKFSRGRNMISKKLVSRGFTVIAVIGLCWLLSACQPAGQGSRTFTTSQAQTAMRSFNGTILYVAEVQIQRDETGAGAVIGGTLGGVVGSTIGSGRGTTLATAGGAAVGAAAGSAGERARGTRPAWELEVQLEDGSAIVVVQEQDDVFEVGDHVRVIEGRDGSFRVRQ